MAYLNRPTKQGGATTYQGKVAAGYKNILASEMDADLEAIYSAWNTGVDTVNIRPGAITGDKLAPGAVGSRELTDLGVQTIDLADGAVTPVKMVNAGAMGGDLTGNFPNPALGVVQGGVVYLNPRARLVAGPSYTDVDSNGTGTTGYDASKSSWLTRTDYGNDVLNIFRAPPGSTAYAPVFRVSNDGFPLGKIYGGVRVLPNAIGPAGPGGPTEVPVTTVFADGGGVATANNGRLTVPNLGGANMWCAIFGSFDIDRNGSFGVVLGLESSPTGTTFTPLRYTQRSDINSISLTILTVLAAGTQVRLTVNNVSGGNINMSLAQLAMICFGI